MTMIWTVAWYRKASLPYVVVMAGFSLNFADVAVDGVTVLVSLGLERRWPADM
ncbi:hypothetical protein [Nocardia sp. NPDC051750]|uniref:hypothetical protein n=1 Tax=Nocardia sp. NPDC051750 TaxID=3364325 RepID=UPI0037878B43